MIRIGQPTRRKRPTAPPQVTPETAKAGPELDSLIAERFYKLPVRWSRPPYFEMPGYDAGQFYPWLYGYKDNVHYDWARVAPYSTDWAAAMRLFTDAIEAFGTGTLSGDMEEWEAEGLFLCAFGDIAAHWHPGPEAICRAVLAVLEDEVTPNG